MRIAVALECLALPSKVFADNWPWRQVARVFVWFASGQPDPPMLPEWMTFLTGTQKKQALRAKNSKPALQNEQC
jgi:hypothetical protein